MIDKNKFIALVRHLVWCGYQMGCGQDFNKCLNDDQLECLLDGVQFRLDHPDTSPEENHANWLKKKKEQGWKWGPLKHMERKEHPDMRPYDELPVVARNKNDMAILAHDMAVRLWDALEGDGKLGHDWKDVDNQTGPHQICKICGERRNRDGGHKEEDTRP